MDIPFHKLRVGEQFRLTSSDPKGEVWVKLTPNHNNHNARSLQSGEFASLEDETDVRLVRPPKGKGPTDFGVA